MKTLTHSAFTAILASHGGALPVGITALTDAKASKGCPHGKVLKQVRAVGFVGADYGKSVEREAERQGNANAEFTARPLPWGTWELPGKVIAHKGGRYLRTQSTPGQRNRQPARVIGYRDTEGRFLAHGDVKPYLPAPSYSVRQGNVGVGDMGAHEQVMVRTYAFSSIRKVRVNGETFELIPDAEGWHGMC